MLNLTDSDIKVINTQSKKSLEELDFLYVFLLAQNRLIYNPNYFPDYLCI